MVTHMLFARLTKGDEPIPVQSWSGFLTVTLYLLT